MLLTTELRNLYCKGVLAVMLAFFAGSLIYTQKGIIGYNDSLKASHEFEKVEKVSGEKNFEYINRGSNAPITFSFLSQPSPIFTLFQNSAPFNSLQATIDCTGVILNIDSPGGGGNQKRLSGFDFDFFTYVSIVSIFLIVLLVYVFDIEPDMAKHARNRYSTLRVYRASVCSKLIYIIAADVLLFGLVLLQLFFNGIKLTLSEILILVNYFIKLLVFQGFVLAAAVLARSFKKRLWKVIVIIAVCIISVFLVDEIITLTKNKFSQFQHVYKKSQAFYNFENYAFKKIINSKESDRGKIYLELLEEYHANLKKIKGLETDMIKNMERDINKSQFKGIFHPAADLSIACGEMSSMGYLAYLDFYKEINDVQYKLAKLYIDKIFYKQTGKLTETTDFKIECVYQMKSRLPKHFYKGLLFNTALLILLFILVYFPFKRSLFPLGANIIKNLKFAAKKGEYILLYVREGIEDFSKRLYNIIFNGEKFGGAITIDGESIVNKKVYYLQDLSGKDMDKLAQQCGGKNPGKPFKELNFAELCELFPQIRECDVLWLDNAGVKIGKEKDIVIIDTNIDLDNAHYTQVFNIVLLKEGYMMNS